MSARYACGSLRRREKVLGSGVWNGIDYLEVDVGWDPVSGTNVPTQLRVVCLSTVGLAALGPANVRLEGGVRFPAPAVSAAVRQPAGGNTLVVTLAPPRPLPNPQFALTDFSAYRLTLTGPNGQGSPQGFDPHLSFVEFSFKVDCPSAFDCGPAPAPEPPLAGPTPDLDYGARDWASFRRLMLDRLAALLPDVPDDTPVDFLDTQVEALASLADHLSYRLDAIATERTLFSARSRISLARHARLLDYPVHEGVNARCFVQLVYEPRGATPAVGALPRGTPVTTDRPGFRASALPSDFERWAGEAPVTFETCHDLALREGNNAIDFHTWSDQQCVLPRGATAATLRVRRAPNAPAADLQAGDFLLLHSIRDAQTGKVQDERRLRHVVRLMSVTPAADPVENEDVLQVAWAEEDALPFELVISAEIRTGADPPQLQRCAEAAGNVALADHGLTLPPRGGTAAAALALAPGLDPPVAASDGRWRPALLRGDLAWIAPPDLGAPLRAARGLQAMDPAEAVPALSLRDRYARWASRVSLLASERFDRDFVVETEHDGSARLRFGDGVTGLAPAPGSQFAVSGRFGRPADGRIGADVLTLAITGVAGIAAVRNPLSAFGALEPVSAAQIRIDAPQAFRSQERAVTEADYAAAAERYPGVQRAVARVRWTGAWRTVFVYVDRVGGLSVEADASFMTGLAAHLDRFRLAGVDVVVRGALDVPLAVTLRACVCPGTLRADVLRALLDRLGSRAQADGTPGFFHPDRFTFGTPLYLSGLIAAALEVRGVASVEVTELRRWARPPAGELAAGVIGVDDLEVLRLANDPSYPEKGRLAIELEGGA